MRRRNAFTLVELLIVIGIIATLIALLLPALSRSREQAKRVQCASNLHQISMLLFAYANEAKGTLPSGKRNPPPGGDSYEHIPWISNDLHDFFVGSSNGTIDVLTCPNIATSGIFGDFINVYQDQYGWVIGYNYLAGHSSATWLGTPWQSPQKVTDLFSQIPAAPILPNNSSLPLACDFTFLSSGLSWAPHGPHGLIYGGPYADPATFGNEGGNVAYLDGSVQWQHQSDMHKYSGDQGGNYFAYW